MSFFADWVSIASTTIAWLWSLHNHCLVVESKSFLERRISRDSRLVFYLSKLLPQKQSNMVVAPSDVTVA